jgi:hypothetical protein
MSEKELTRKVNVALFKFRHRKNLEKLIDDLIAAFVEDEVQKESEEQR